MHENQNRLLGSLYMDSQARQKLCMVGGERTSEIESARSHRSTAPADRSDEIREIATNLERLAIVYSCQHRVNGTGNETRAAWSAFKAQIERLKGVA
jgi:hypothetical protein